MLLAIFLQRFGHQQTCYMAEPQAIPKVWYIPNFHPSSVTKIRLIKHKGQSVLCIKWSITHSFNNITQPQAYLWYNLGTICKPVLNLLGWSEHFLKAKESFVHQVMWSCPSLISRKIIQCCRQKDQIEYNAYHLIIT